MKLIKCSLTIFYIFIVICQCRPPEFEPLGAGSMDFNGKKFEGPFHAYNSLSNREYWYIIYYKLNFKGIREYTLEFDKVPKRPGKYKLGNDKLNSEALGLCYSYTDLGYLFGDKYRVDLTDTIEDYLEIMEYDENTIRASFQLSMIKDTTRNKENDFRAPFHIDIRKGTFFSEIIR